MYGFLLGNLNNDPHYQVMFETSDITATAPTALIAGSWAIRNDDLTYLSGFGIPASGQIHAVIALEGITCKMETSIWWGFSSISTYSWNHTAYSCSRRR